MKEEEKMLLDPKPLKEIPLNFGLLRKNEPRGVVAVIEHKKDQLTKDLSKSFYKPVSRVISFNISNDQ